MATKKEKEKIMKLIQKSYELDLHGDYIDSRQENGTWRDGLQDALNCLD